MEKMMNASKKQSSLQTAAIITLCLFVGASCGTSQLGDDDTPTTTTDQQADRANGAAEQPSAGGQDAPTGVAADTTDDTGTGAGEAGAGGATPTDTDSAPERPDTIDEKVAVEYILRYVVQAQLDAFATEAAALDASLQTLVEAPTDSQLLDTARSQWRATMAIWQRIEVMRFGPIGASERVGGKSIGNFVYIANGTNLCMVDQVVARATFRDDGWIDNVLTGYNVQGLGAIAYLLFNDQADSNCKPNHKLIVDGEWDVIKADPTQLKVNRYEYAAVLATRVKSLGEELVAEWSDDAFGSAFAGGKDPYVSHQAVLDEVFAGLFYLDKKVKDLKLAAPLGLSAECESDCAGLVEFPYASFSKAALISNLEGAKHLFQGGPQSGYVGLNALLEEKGAGSLAEDIVAKIDAAIEAVESIEGALDAAVVNNANQVQVAYDAVRKITDDLKGPFVTVLSLTLPAEGKGDSD